MSFAEVCLVIGGYDDRLHDEWLQTREIAYMVYCLGTDPKERERKEQFMPLRNKNELQQKKRTPAEIIRATKERWKKIDEQRKNKPK